MRALDKPVQRRQKDDGGGNIKLYLEQIERTEKKRTLGGKKEEVRTGSCRHGFQLLEKAKLRVRRSQVQQSEPVSFQRSPESISPI